MAPAILVAGATRPKPGETANGDAFRVDWDHGTCRISVIDGLGHGPEAQAAADRAQEILAAHPESDPETALHQCHRALSGTRGAAISIACLEVATARLTYAGIGNVEGRVWQADRDQRLVTYRGIVGSIMRTVRPMVVPLHEDWVLVLHTDGIRSRFGVALMLPCDTQLLTERAEALLDEWARPTDDATVVLASPAFR